MGKKTRKNRRERQKEKKREQEAGSLLLSSLSNPNTNDNNNSSSSTVNCNQITFLKEVECYTPAGSSLTKSNNNNKQVTLQQLLDDGNIFSTKPMLNFNDCNNFSASYLKSNSFIKNNSCILSIPASTFIKVNISEEDDEDEATVKLVLELLRYMENIMDNKNKKDNSNGNKMELVRELCRQQLFPAWAWDKLSRRLRGDSVPHLFFPPTNNNSNNNNNSSDNNNNDDDDDDDEEDDEEDELSMKQTLKGTSLLASSFSFEKQVNSVIRTLLSDPTKSKLVSKYQPRHILRLLAFVNAYCMSGEDKEAQEEQLFIPPLLHTIRFSEAPQLQNVVVKYEALDGEASEAAVKVFAIRDIEKGENLCCSFLDDWSTVDVLMKFGNSYLCNSFNNSNPNDIVEIEPELVVQECYIQQTSKHAGNQQAVQKAIESKVQLLQELGYLNDVFEVSEEVIPSLLLAVVRILCMEEDEFELYSSIMQSDSVELAENDSSEEDSDQENNAHAQQLKPSKLTFPSATNKNMPSSSEESKAEAEESNNDEGSGEEAADDDDVDDINDLDDVPEVNDELSVVCSLIRIIKAKLQIYPTKPLQTKTEVNTLTNINSIIEQVHRSALLLRSREQAILNSVLAILYAAKQSLQSTSEEEDSDNKRKRNDAKETSTANASKRQKLE